ncbi:MAG TPA: hypothetical protein VKY19_14975 [Ktedonosporobacter sp.]|nr:hypothetical protein [Ktedonosporobacter sp.]
MGCVNVVGSRFSATGAIDRVPTAGRHDVGERQGKRQGWPCSKPRWFCGGPWSLAQWMGRGNALRLPCGGPCYRVHRGGRGNALRLPCGGPWPLAQWMGRGNALRLPCC